MRRFSQPILLAIALLLAVQVPHAISSSPASRPDSLREPVSTALLGLPTSLPDPAIGFAQLTVPKVWGAFYDPPEGRIIAITNWPGWGYGFELLSLSPTNYSIAANNSLIGWAPGQWAVDTTNGDIFLLAVQSLPNGMLGNESLLVLSGSNLSILKVIPAGSLTGPLLFDPVNGDLYIANGTGPGFSFGTPCSGELLVFSTATDALVGTVPQECAPMNMTVDTSNGNVFVANSHTGDVVVVSGANQSVLTTIPDLAPGDWGRCPVSFDPDDGEVYILGPCDSNELDIDVINGSTATLITSISVPGEFRYWPAINYSAGQVLVAVENTIVAISDRTRSIATAASLPCGATSLLADPADGELYVGDVCGSVVVLAQSTLGTLFDVAVAAPSSINEPYDCITVLDPLTGVVMGVCAQSGFFPSTIGWVGQYPISFSVSGWTLGASWTVAVRDPWGHEVSMTTDDPVATVLGTNGTYSYSISAPLGYTIAPQSGVLTAYGSGTTVVVEEEYVWWFWFVLAVSVIAVGVLGFRARREARRALVRRLPTLEKFRWDLEHPFTDGHGKVLYRSDANGPPSVREKDDTPVRRP